MAKSSSGGRLKALMFLMVSMFAALLAAVVIFAVIRNFQNQLREARKPPELKEIIVAKRTLWPGMTIVPEYLENKKYPPRFIPDEAIQVGESAIGRVPLERILVGEFIRNERLASRDAGSGLNAIVPQGMRAISLDISGGSAVSGFLNPGNYVDILVTITDGEKILNTVVLLEAVTVLAVNDRLGNAERLSKAEQKKKKQNGEGGSRRVRSKPSVTIAVTPDQAERVIYAQEQGRITLTLRNDIDVTAVDTHAPMKKERLIGKGGEDGDRIDLKLFNERRPQDGTTILIKGDRKETEKARRR